MKKHEDTEKKDEGGRMMDEIRKIIQKLDFLDFLTILLRKKCIQV
jgi:hypothetical protein